MDQLLQIAGALMILTAFVAAQLGRVSQRGYVYLTLNMVGSAILAGLAYQDQQWGFLLLEGVWAVVSLAGIIRRASAPRQAPARPDPSMSR